MVPRPLEATPGHKPFDRLRMGLWTLGDLLRRKGPRPAGLLAHIAAQIARPFSGRRYRQMLLASHRFWPTLRGTEEIKTITERRSDSFCALLRDDIPLRRAASRALVLRPPVLRNGELIPGVLLIKFTETLRFFALRVDVNRLQQFFRLVFEPSWAGYAVPEILAFSNACDPILVASAEKRDRVFLKELRSSLVPTPLGSGDWVDHRIFRPLGLEKTYGSVYVANYTASKRVPAYLRAVRKAADLANGYRAAIVCSRWGPGRHTALRFIDHFDLRKRVDVYEALSQTELNEVLCQARCIVLMSLKEGSNRSLFEGMFANIPGIVLKENVGVNKHLFTSDSGFVVLERDLPLLLAGIERGEARTSPRDWAMSNISPEASTRKLEKTLKDLFPEDEKSPGLLQKVNNPEASYFDDSLRRLQDQISNGVVPQFLKGSVSANTQSLLQATSYLLRADGRIDER